MSTTKIITTISAQQTAEGFRIGYTYSEIDENGEITSRHNAGAFMAVGQDELDAVHTLMEAAGKKVNK